MKCMAHDMTVEQKQMQMPECVRERKRLLLLNRKSERLHNSWELMQLELAPHVLEDSVHLAHHCWFHIMPSTALCACLHRLSAEIIA